MTVSIIDVASNARVWCAPGCGGVAFMCSDYAGDAAELSIYQKVVLTRAESS